MYELNYEVGNGYSCSCCRTTDIYHKEFKTKEELIEWLIDFYASCKLPMYYNEDDQIIEEISTYMYVKELDKVIKVDVTDDIENEVLNNYKDKIEEYVAARQKKLDDKKKAEENREKKIRRKKYEALKKEFENK